MAAEPAAPRPSSPASAPLLAIQRREYGWLDLLETADYLGLLDARAHRLARGQALAAAARDAGEELDGATVQAAANAWRYRLHLITAAETQIWLDQRGLTLDDLYEFLCRELWLGNPPQAAPAPAPELAPDALAAHLWADALLGQRFWPLATPFIRRAIAAALVLNPGPPGGTLPADVGRARRFGRTAPEVLAEREARYAQFCAEIASAGNCRRRLSAMRPQLLGVRYEVATFANPEVAREAQLCANVDREPLAAVTGRAGGRYAELEAFVADLPEVLRQRLLSAASQECLAPVPGAVAGEWLVYRLAEKREPDLAAPAVSQRVRECLIEDTFAQYLHQDVRWLRFTPD